MKKHFLALGLVAAFSANLMLATPLLAADQPKQIAKSGDWTVYSLQDGGATVCFMASKPIKTEGLSAKAKRGDTYALLTHRTDETAPYVFSFQTGYTYQAQSEVTVKIDGQSYSLFTQDDTAWAKSAETDQAIADAIRKGKNMVVSGTSSRGTNTTDTISLKGTGNAFREMAKACRIGE